MLSCASEGVEEDIADEVDGDSHNQQITRIEHTISLTAIRHLPDWLETIVIGTQPADRSSAQRFGRLRVSLSVKQHYSFENILVEEPAAPALDEPICLGILTRRRSSASSFYSSPTTWKLHALQQPIPHGLSAGGRRAGAYVSGGGTSSRSSVGGSDVYEEVLRNPVVLAFVHTQMQQEQRVRHPDDALVPFATAAGPRDDEGQELAKHDQTKAKAECRVQIRGFRIWADG
eukprot:g15176.t1